MSIAPNLRLSPRSPVAQAQDLAKINLRVVASSWRTAADWSIWDLAYANHYQVEEDAAAESAAVFVVVEAAVAGVEVVVGAVVEAATPIHSKGYFPALVAYQYQTPTGSYANQKKTTHSASEMQRKVMLRLDHSPLARDQV